VTYVAGTNFLLEGQVIPTSVLTTEDGKPGLKGEYFSEKDFEGTPAVCEWMQQQISSNFTLIRLRLRSLRD